MWLRKSEQTSSLRLNPIIMPSLKFSGNSLDFALLTLVLLVVYSFFKSLHKFLWLCIANRSTFSFFFTFLPSCNTMSADPQPFLKLPFVYIITSHLLEFLVIKLLKLANLSILVHSSLLTTPLGIHYSYQYICVGAMLIFLVAIF